MSKKLLAVLILCSLSVFGQVSASDDIYVDLSVLDNMPSDSIGFVQSEPLFPIYKPSKPVAKPTKKVRLRSQTSAHKAPVVTVKAEKLPPMQAETPEEEQEPLTDEQKTPALENTDETTIATPLPEDANSNRITTSESVEQEKTVTTEAPTEITQTQTPIPQNSENQVQIISYPPVVDAVYGISGQEEKPSQDAVNPEDSQNLSQAEAQITMSASSTNISEPNEAMQISSPKEIYSLTFAESSSDITNENIQKLEKMISTFDADRKKKIIIKAYNYDTGEDSFKHKRVSLNRATAIRSYFLNKGFVNFSIKIINTDSENEYKNTVEIEEIK